MRDGRRRRRRDSSHHSATLIVSLRIAFLLVVFLSWEVAAGGFGVGIELVSPLLFPPPSATAVALVDYVGSTNFLQDARATLAAAFVGLIGGIFFGVLLGMIFGYSELIARVFEPIMVALNSLPRIALAPLFLLWLGLGTASKAALSLTAVIFVVFFNTYLGIRAVDRDLALVVQTMGGSKWDATRHVTIPSVSAWIFAALRTAAAFALTGTIVGEFVGASRGIGYRMLIAAGLLNTPRVFGIMFILMLIGLILVESARRAETYLLRWRPGPAA